MAGNHGNRGNWSHCIYSQEAESEQELGPSYKISRPTLSDPTASSKGLPSNGSAAFPNNIISVYHESRGRVSILCVQTTEQTNKQKVGRLLERGPHLFKVCQDVQRGQDVVCASAICMASQWLDLGV